LEEFEQMLQGLFVRRVDLFLVESAKCQSEKKRAGTGKSTVVECYRSFFAAVTKLFDTKQKTRIRHNKASKCNGSIMASTVELRLTRPKQVITLFHEFFGGAHPSPGCAPFSALASMAI
jgi:hypothetical protein